MKKMAKYKIVKIGSITHEWATDVSNQRHFMRIGHQITIEVDGVQNNVTIIDKADLKEKISYLASHSDLNKWLYDHVNQELDSNKLR